MKTFLNGPGLKALLEAENGPVGREVQFRAARVVFAARRNVAIITDRFPIPVEQDVGYEMRPGPAAVVGIRDTGSVTRYLAEKADRERDSWLIPALREAFPD